MNLTINSFEERFRKIDGVKFYVYIVTGQPTVVFSSTGKPTIVVPKSSIPTGTDNLSIMKAAVGSEAVGASLKRFNCAPTEFEDKNGNKAIRRHEWKLVSDDDNQPLAVVDSTPVDEVVEDLAS